MADEISTNDIAVEPVVLQEVSKKKRAPRRSKEQIAADLAAKKSAKGVRKAALASTAASPSFAAKRVGEATSKGAVSRGAAKATKPAATANAASDGFADLIALEEENQKLRKSLAEKLRSENADLRKKLGLD
jgi:hypothetical protein